MPLVVDPLGRTGQYRAMSSPPATLYPTYVPATVQGVHGTKPGALVSLGPAGGVVVSDSLLVSNSPAQLTLAVSADEEPVTVRAEILRARQVEDTTGVVNQPFCTAEVRFVNPPTRLAQLTRDEAAAAARGRRLVIVDDDPMQLALLKRIAQILGYDPLCISDSVGAAKLITATQPLLVVLDINMPRLDGRRLCQMLREQPRSQTLPIIFLSALPTHDIKQAVAEYGADGFIEKGADFNTLLAELHRYARR